MTSLPARTGADRRGGGHVAARHQSGSIRTRPELGGPVSASWRSSATPDPWPTRGWGVGALLGANGSSCWAEPGGCCNC